MVHPFVYAVRRECLYRRIPPEELAHRTGFSLETIQALLKGQPMLYSPDFVDWLADALELQGYERRAFFEEAELTLADQGDRVFYRVFIQLCQERRQTIESMARKTGLHPTHIEAFLQGEISPTVDHLEELADALDLQDQDRLMFFRAGGYDIPELADDDNGPLSPPLEPLRVFYCYAQEDQALQQILDKHLGLLKRMRMITTWHNCEIQAGTDWEQEIAEHLQAAHLILLLISPDFITSDYCYGTEMQKALAFHEEGQARVVPILLRPVDWRGAPFTQLPILPYNKQPITSPSWANQDEACYEIARQLRTIIETWEAMKEDEDESEDEKDDGWTYRDIYQGNALQSKHAGSVTEQNTDLKAPDG